MLIQLDKFPARHAFINNYHHDQWHSDAMYQGLCRLHQGSTYTYMLCLQHTDLLAFQEKPIILRLEYRLNQKLNRTSMIINFWSCTQ